MIRVSLKLLKFPIKKTSVAQQNKPLLISLQKCSYSTEAEKFKDVGKSRQQPVFLNRKFYNSINLTLSVFRDLDQKYLFLKISPPVINIDVHKVSSTFWIKFASQTNDKHDILEAWHLLASHSDLMIDEQSQSIQEEITMKISQTISEYSYDQLADLLFNLRVLYKKPDSLKSFVSILDKSLTKKMREILNQKNPSSEVIDKCLNVSFIWLRTQMEFNQTLEHGVNLENQYKLKGSHNRSMLDILIGKHIKILNSEQLMFTLFLSSLQKRFPLYHPKFKDNQQGLAMPNLLYKKLCLVIPELSRKEVGLLCGFIHLSHIYLETKHSFVRQAALDCLIKYDKREVVRDQFIIANISKLLKKRGSENHIHCIKVMDKYKHHLPSLGAYTSIRLLQFLLPGKPSQAESREFLVALCDSLCNNLNTLRLKDLEMLAFGLYFLNNKDVNDKMRDAIADAMFQCEWADVRSGRSFVFLIQILANMGKYDLDSINTIITSANNCSMKDLDTVEGLTEAVSFIFKLNIPFVSDQGEKHIKKYINNARYLMRNTLFSLLHLDGIREIYSLDCATLDTDLRQSLTTYFHSLPEHEFFSSLEENVDLEGNIEFESKSFSNSTKAFVYRDLVMILNGEEYIWTGHPYPHSTASIFILKRHKDGNFLKIPDKFESFTKDGIISRRDENSEYLAVLVPSKGQTDFHGNLFGPIQSNVEQLKILGYTPLIIFWGQYFRELKRKKNLSFLRKMLIKGNEINTQRRINSLNRK